MIELIGKVVPDAYHGTSKENAQKIFQEKKFLFSKGKRCYLGTGIYFFEGSKELAEWWGKKQYPATEIGIILAEIQLGKCLDLTIPEFRTFLKKTKRELEVKRPYNRITDAFVINYVCHNMLKFETVKCIFTRVGEVLQFPKLYPGSRIYDELYITICVKNHSNILCFRIVDGGLQ
jgi:hypothetical protein